MHSKNETVALGWCDNGMVDGKFTEGLFFTYIHHKNLIADGIRAQGNQIGRQRQVLIDEWYKQNNTDWLLWVDSDIVLTPQVFQMLWDVADKATKPVVTGVYFISKENEQTMMAPFPCLFMDTDDEHNIAYVHPLPANEIIRVDSAGMGLVLMHRSVVTKLKEKFPDESVFAEQPGIGVKFVSEDIVFFRKLKEAGIPVHAHTGARVKHMKRFALDENYYHNYWQIHALVMEERKRNDAVSKLV
jgi:GT2 family glycosyltransferase